jgi:hypothetical protein
MKPPHVGTRELETGRTYAKSLLLPLISRIVYPSFEELQRWVLIVTANGCELDYRSNSGFHSISLAVCGSGRDSIEEIYLPVRSMSRLRRSVVEEFRKKKVQR